jgi:NDP-sugar pyrophosphorylase family protein
MVPVPYGARSHPFLDFVLGQLQSQGCTEIVICIGHLGDAIRTHFGDGSRFGLRIAYDEAGTVSTGMRVISAAAQVEASSFLVVCGDTYHPIDIAAFVRSFDDHPHWLAQLAIVDRSDNTANVAVDSRGAVLAYDPVGVRGERTGLETGTVAMRRTALEGFIASGNLSLTGDIYPRLIARRTMGAWRSGAAFFDVGTPDGYQRFCAFVAGGGAAPVSTPAV